jgi:ribonuclease HI
MFNLRAFTWVKGHDGTLRNEESDKLAKEGAMKEITRTQEKPAGAR